FTIPNMLLDKLIERANCPSWVSESDRKVIHLRVLNALKYWSTHYPEDFDEQLTVKLSHFLDQLPENEKAVKGSILKKLESKTENEDTRDYSNEKALR